MEFLTVTDIDGNVHLVNPAEIVHVSPSRVTTAAACQMVLSSGATIFIPSSVATFATNIVIAIPTVTIGPLP